MSRVNDGLPPATVPPEPALPPFEGSGPTAAAPQGSQNAVAHTDGVEASVTDDGMAFKNFAQIGEAVDRLKNVAIVKLADIIRDAIAVKDPAVEETKKRLAMNKQVDVVGPTDVQVDGYHYDDVKQRGLGDCYLMASLASLARQDPAAIDRLISNEKYGPDGNLVSCTVTLHVRNSRGELEPIEVEVDCTQFAAMGSDIGDKDAAGKQELWPKIIEKAYAQIHPEGYYGIGRGGSPEVAMEALTGKEASTSAMGAVSFEQIQADVNAGKVVGLTTVATHDNDRNVIPGKEKLAGEYAGLNIYGNHVYAVVDTRVDESGQRYVKLYNPWGEEQPGEDGWVKFEDAQKLFGWATTGTQ